MVDSGRATRWLTAATWGYVVVVLAVALIPDRLLGHDEAVYAVGARGLWSGEAADEFPLHRSIGMRVLAAPGVAAGGGDELAIRIPFALIALGYLAAVYLIARRWFGPAAAALAIAVQATMAPWLWRAAEALSDIPSALALLGVVGLCAGAGEDRSPRAWARAVAAGGLAAIACYLRYASAPAVAAIFAVALASDPRSWRWLMIAGLAGVVAIAINWRGAAPRLMLAMCVLLGLTFLWGTGVASYHSLVEWKVLPAPDTCTAGALNLNISGDPLEALKRPLHPPSCGDAAWRDPITSLSMAGWNAIFSLVFAALSFFSATRPMRTDTANERIEVESAA